MVDIPESLPGVPDVSGVRHRDMPLPSPSVSGSDAPPSRTDTPTYASSSGGPAALCTPSSSVALGAPSSSAADSCRPVLSPGHLPHTDGSLRSLPPTAPASRSPTPPPQVVSPTTERARRKEQAFSHLLGELSPISDMTVVPSIIELQGRFPGLGKVCATTEHERLIREA